MKIFSVEEIKTHVNEGTSDDELMQTYGLSPDELKALYHQLIKAMAAGSTYVQIGPLRRGSSNRDNSAINQSEVL
jgi:hypothetical protein